MIRGVRRPPARSGRILSGLLVLLLILVGFAGVLLSFPASLGTCTASYGPSAPPGRTPVQHVFFLIKENHALENYFATYPGVIGTPPTGSFAASYHSNATVAPFPLPGFSTPDLPHDRLDAVAAWDGGRNDHFVAQADSSGALAPDDAVGYYTARQVGSYFQLAQNYTLDDLFFSGILGPTLPNRLFDLAATSGNWTSDEVPAPGTLTFPTILDQLSVAGIPWVYDYGGSERNLTPTMLPSIASDPCRLALLEPMANLTAQVNGPSAPAVTFLDPSHDPNVSEHPPQNVSIGATWTVSVLRTIFSSPIGSTSAVFLFYDEAGGFWDPVAPPVFGPYGDGLRVPFLLISPWSRGGHIAHLPLDPASLLKFVDANWRLPPLNDRVAQAAPVDSLFNFTTVAPPSLPAGAALARPWAPPPPAAPTVGVGVGIIPALARPESWSAASSPSITPSRSWWSPRAPSSRSP